MQDVQLQHACAQLATELERGQAADDGGAFLRAAEWAGRALSLVDDRNPLRVQLLTARSHALLRAFTIGRRPADLSEAWRCAALAYQAARAPDPAADVAGLQLSTVLRTVFEESGSAEHLEEAARIATRLAETGRGTDEFGAALSDQLGVVWRLRFGLSRDAGQLDEAVRWARRAVRLTRDEGDRWSAMTNLTGTLLIRYEQRGAREDLEEAMAASERALATLPAGHRLVPLVESQLGWALRLRAERTGNDGDLDRAVAMLTVAASHPPAGQSARAQANLAYAYRTRFDRYGGESDLERAVVLLRRAAQSAGTDQPDATALLADLAGALRLRFDLGGGPEDLRAGLAAIDEAFARLSRDDRRRVDLWAARGALQLSMFSRTHSPRDVAAAVEAQRSALAEAPAGFPTAGLEAGLAAALRCLATASGRAEMVEEAVAAGRRALAALPADDPRRPDVLVELCASLVARWREGAQRRDLDEAVELGRAAVAATPAEHPDAGRRFAALADALSTRDGPGDAESALDLWSQAAAAEPAATGARIEAARRWGELGARLGRWAEAAGGFGAALRLAPLLAWRAPGRPGADDAGPTWAELGADAAAAALSAEDADAAVELGEQGRLASAQALLGWREPLDQDLVSAHPELARRLMRARTALDVTSTAGTVEALPS